MKRGKVEGVAKYHIHVVQTRFVCLRSYVANQLPCRLPFTSLCPPRTHTNVPFFPPIHLLPCPSSIPHPISTKKSFCERCSLKETRNNLLGTCFTEFVANLNNSPVALNKYSVSCGFSPLPVTNLAQFEDVTRIQKNSQLSTFLHLIVIFSKLSTRFLCSTMPVVMILSLRNTMCSGTAHLWSQGHRVVNIGALSPRTTFDGIPSLFIPFVL